MLWNRELIKNKIIALLLVFVGALNILVNKDATIFIFTLIIGFPLFFSKENWIV